MARVEQRRRVASKTKKKSKARRVGPPRRDVKASADEFSAMGGAPMRASGSDRSASKSATRELAWPEFDRQVQLLAREVSRRFKPDAVVGLAHGGVFVGGAIASVVQAEFFPVRISRRSRDSGQTPVATALPRELKGRRVLLVDDVAATGDSLELAVRLAKAAGAAKTATAALVTRPHGYTPDFTAYTSGALFVFPWDYHSVVQQLGRTLGSDGEEKP